MSYAAHIYVDANGNTYGASSTDQRYTQRHERTVSGRPVAYAGKWFGSQMSYRPYQMAVQDAQKLARAKTIGE